MVHSGYEASAVDHTFSSLSGLWATMKATFSSTYADPQALAELEKPAPPSGLVQLQAAAKAK
jgi:hypothetical protein